MQYEIFHYLCSPANNTFNGLRKYILYMVTYKEKTSIGAFLSLLLLALIPASSPKAQEIAVKTNAVYDATATINAGVEVAIAPRWTLDISGNFNGWNQAHQRRWKHWLAQPEARYWFCDPFAGHFIGMHLHGGQYNMGGLDNNISFLGTDFSGLSDYRYQGWFIGAGVAYGYSVILGRHWNLEFEIGIGYAYTRYDQFNCVGCGRKIKEDQNHHYFGPTKAAVNLIYVF